MARCRRHRSFHGRRLRAGDGRWHGAKRPVARREGEALAVDNTIRIDNQPISAGFFGQGKWLTDWVTPDDFEVRSLYENITRGITGTKERLVSLWKWVADEVKYVKYVQAKTWIAGRASAQNDYWQEPGELIRTRVGNCANVSFLLTSLLRNELSPDEAYCVLGNLYSDDPGGHAWALVRLEGQDYIMEATSSRVPPLVPEKVATKYEAVHYFNDERVLAVPGATQLVPYAAYYSEWLSEYLNWAYIHGQQNSSR